MWFVLIAEACGGGWGPTAMQTALATRTGETAATEKVKLLQAEHHAAARERACSCAQGGLGHSISSRPGPAMTRHRYDVFQR